jgi:tetratricopeptide (TPR) repeat protein
MDWGLNKLISLPDWQGCGTLLTAMPRFFLIALLAVITFSGPAFSQQMVRVRAGEHEDYSRIVFDWDEPVDYEIKRISSGLLRMNFQRRSALDLSDAAAVRLNNIHSVEQLGPSGRKTIAQIRISPGSIYKHFTSGTKVILDVYNSVRREEKGKSPKPSTEEKRKRNADSGRAEKSESGTERTPKSRPAPKPDAGVEIKAESENKKPPEKTEDITGDIRGDKSANSKKSSEKPRSFDKDEKKFVSKEQNMEPKHVKKPDPDLGPQPEEETGDIRPPAFSKHGAAGQEPEFRIYKPHLITFSVTEAVGMAAFELNGMLWIILDRSEISIQPQISGPQKDEFPPFVRHDIRQGTAFSMPVPENAEIYSEGGGLIWRVILSPYEKNLKPVEVQRRFRPGNKIRNGELFWLFPEVTGLLKMQDPVSGVHITAAAVKVSDQFAGKEQDFVDLKLLHSIVGLAIVPKNDGVKVTLEEPGVLVSHKKGLALMEEADIISRKARESQAPVNYENAREEKTAEEKSGSGIYNFSSWQMGGRKKLANNQRVLMAGLSTKDKTGHVEDIITIAKLNMANGWGSEALGFLNLASQYMSLLAESPEFLALRGAAAAIAGKFEQAFEDLSIEALNDKSEIEYWRAYVLAGLEDWQQAMEFMPEKFGTIASYPDVIFVPLGLKLAEVALRAGKVEKGEQLLGLVEKNSAKFTRPQKNTWQYLSGEARRQHGHYDEAEKLWKPLANGFDELYRAKAGLALTEMLLRRKEITPGQAIDLLERLRYLWRGDEIETRINYRLGTVYIENGKFTKGLNILREAAALAPKSRLGRQITDEMTKTFRELFLGNKYRKLTPLEAITLYEKFPELTPTGKEGDRLVEKLAETLVDADLLDRAAKILQHQVDHRLEGGEAARVAIRLAAIYLIDRQPKKALTSLNKAEEILYRLDEASRGVKGREIKLLRARALSQLNKPVKAIEILVEMPVDPDVNRLRADIAWRAGEWDEAAEAIGQMIVDAGVSPARSLTPMQAELVMNRAIALNLADNRVALSQLRERFQDQMKNTSRGRIFEVLTRPRKSMVLSDRETLMSVVSEVDIFGDFLETYRTGPADTQ